LSINTATISVTTVLTNNEKWQFTCNGNVSYQITPVISIYNHVSSAAYATIDLLTSLYQPFKNQSLRHGGTELFDFLLAYPYTPTKISFSLCLRVSAVQVF